MSSPSTKMDVTATDSSGGLTSSQAVNHKVAPTLDAPAALISSHNAVPFLEADEEDGQIAGDNDSAIADVDIESTASMRSSILQYREENGRTYHSFKEGKYWGPNDEAENDRLDLQHHMFSLTYEGALGLCPMNEKGSNAKRVLDVGCGTGIWAMDFADEHPESEVIGVDLSPIQPTFVPPNLAFEIDDVDEPWTYTRKFDYIHSRMMTGSLKWATFFEQSFNNLEPGGYLELQDAALPIKCDDGTLLPEHALFKWSAYLMEASAMLGRPLDTPLHFTELLTAAGFVNITAKMDPWPQNQWPKDKKLKELGAWTLENQYDGCEGVCLALFTRALGWSKEEVDLFIAKVRKDLRNTKIHAYWPIWTVYAQKPE